MLAGAAMALSSVFVVSNSLRLRRFTEPVRTPSRPSDVGRRTAERREPNGAIWQADAVRPSGSRGTGGPAGDSRGSRTARDGGPGCRCETELSRGATPPPRRSSGGREPCGADRPLRSACSPRFGPDPGVPRCDGRRRAAAPAGGRSAAAGSTRPVRRCSTRSVTKPGETIRTAWISERPRPPGGWPGWRPWPGWAPGSGTCATTSSNWSEALLVLFGLDAGHAAELRRPPRHAAPRRRRPCSSRRWPRRCASSGRSRSPTGSSSVTNRRGTGLRVPRRGARRRRR